MRYQITWSVFKSKEWLIKKAFITGDNISEINRKFYAFLADNKIDEDKNFVFRENWGGG